MRTTSRTYSCVERGAGYRILREVHVLEAASRRPFSIRVGERPLLYFLLYWLTYFALLMETPLTSTTPCTSPLLSASQTMQLDAP